MKKIKSIKHYKKKYFKKALQLDWVKKYYLKKYNNKSIGSKEWLISMELKYGGLSTNVKRNKLSELDPRLKIKKQKLFDGIGMSGGDRMLYHGYAEYYSKYLMDFFQNQKIVLVEVGILKGVGLAIWCDLFKNSRIIGYDIDLKHINDNMVNLKEKNAFSYNKPELYEFDIYQNNIDFLNENLKEDKVDVCIDDGPHTDESILKNFENFIPFLSNKFIYFIEDNKQVYKKIRKLYPQYTTVNYGELTVVTK